MNKLQVAMRGYVAVVELSTKVSGFNLPAEVQTKIVQAGSEATLGKESKAAEHAAQATRILRGFLGAFIRNSPVHFARVIRELQVGEDLVERVKAVLARYQETMPVSDTLEAAVKLYAWMHNSIELTKAESARRVREAETMRIRETRAAEIERRRAQVAPWHEELARIKVREAGAVLAEIKPRAVSTPAQPVLDLGRLASQWGARVKTIGA